MGKRRKPEPGYISPRQRLWRTLSWVIAMIAVLIVFYLMLRWKQPY